MGGHAVLSLGDPSKGRLMPPTRRSVLAAGAALPLSPSTSDARDADPDPVAMLLALTEDSNAALMVLSV